MVPNATGKLDVEANPFRVALLPWILVAVTVPWLMIGVAMATEVLVVPKPGVLVTNLTLDTCAIATCTSRPANSNSGNTNFRWRRSHGRTHTMPVPISAKEPGSGTIVTV